VMALVDFFEPSEARSAYRALAYRPFKHVPLYLEWAPVDSFKKPAANEKEDGKSEEAPAKKGKAKVKNDLEEALEAEDAEALTDGTATVYVTNLNFKTTSEDLTKVFSKKTKGVRSATVATKKNPKGGEALSMGFGFVEYATKDDAMTALKQLGSLTIDDHELKMKISTRTSAAQSGARGTARATTGVPKVTKGKSATKIVIRNVPFEANKKELMSLFNTFGQVKNTRMPKKFDGSHRGFAFVEFLTKEEAKAAVEALAATHLYGRHLVIEYASEDTSLEAIQTKAKRDIEKQVRLGGAGPKLKKQKKDEFDLGDEED